MIFNERRPKKELTVVETWKFNYPSYDNLRRFPEPDSFPVLFPQFRSNNQFFDLIAARESNYLVYENTDGKYVTVYDLMGAGWEKESYRTVEFFGTVPNWFRTWLKTVATKIL